MTAAPRTGGPIEELLGRSGRFFTPGEFSDPAWVAVSPSASRNALCTRWVAVWAREMARRRSRSTAPTTSLPTTASPEIARE